MGYAFLIQTAQIIVGLTFAHQMVRIDAKDLSMEAVIRFDANVFILRIAKPVANERNGI